MLNPPDYSEWVTRLVSDNFGRLWLRKFQYDLENGNIAADIEDVFKLRAEVKLSATSGIPWLQLVESLLQENPVLFDLKGLRIPPNHEPYSVIVNLETYSYFYLRRRVLVTILDEGDEELDFIWSNIGGIITPRFHEGRLRTGRAFFWCAPTEVIDVIVSGNTPDQAASLIRDRLGLHHVGEGQRLVRIDIPANALVGKRLCAPTTLDSGTNPVFIPFNAADGYGRTLNLVTIERDLKELVAEEVSFDETFTAARVGTVETNVPTISWANVEALVQ